MTGIFDVVVIGAGHNGLSAALELSGAGLSVLVVEAQATAGGCATTSESLLPGFRHSPHANCLIYADLLPATIAPARLKSHLHQAEAQLGVAFADGRPPVILHRPDLLAKTRKSLGVYSDKDAKTYAELKRRSARFGPLIAKGLYNAPGQEWFAEQAAAVRAAYRSVVNMRSLGSGSARALIDQMFEAPEIRILLYYLALETGLTLEEPGSDIAFLGYSLWVAGRWRIPVGGMGTYVEALAKAATTSGATLKCSTRVTRIMVEGTRAVGIETACGDIIRASRAVLAATPVIETFGMVDETAIAMPEREEMRAFQRERPGSIASSQFCLDQPPRYKSARHDPQIDACLKTVVGHETPASVTEQDRDILAGRLPKPAGVVRVHSLWDPTLAPHGQHMAGVDSNFPAMDHFCRTDRQMVEAAFPEALFSVWSSYCADGLTRPLAMATNLSSPFERRMLFRLGAAQYRSSIAGLYLAGPGIYPGGGVHGACGLNAARTFLDDSSRLGEGSPN